MERRISFLLSSVPKFLNLVAVKQSSVYTFIPSVYLVPLVSFLKKSSLFCVDQLVDICVSDHVSYSRRFSFFYVLSSTHYQYRFFLRTFFAEGEAVPSFSSMFPNAIWLEREIWDMFGIFFSNHPDLRRILTDYGFDGFPMRKDFPLSGYIELRYDDEKMHIVYEPLELAQNFRYFNFLSPWEKTKI